MPQTSERIRGFTESVIRRMTRIANQFGAINLSQGFPDFDPPQALIDAGVEAMRKGPHQYAVTWGAADFRQALAAKQSPLLGIPIDPDKNLVVTCGSTEAMMAAMLTVCNAGEKVIVFSPFYENYGAEFIRGTDHDDTYFAEWLARRIGVAAVPGSSFFREPVHNYIRFHFAKRVDTLNAAGERLLELRKRWAEDHA